MIIENTPITIAEVANYSKEEEKPEVLSFVKKFGKLDLKDSEELKNKLNELNNLKLKQEHIIKIIDLLPEDQDDLNKIVNVSLDENETKQILDAVKQFK